MHSVHYNNCKRGMFAIEYSVCITYLTKVQSKIAWDNSYMWHKNREKLGCVLALFQLKLTRLYYDFP